MKSMRQVASMGALVAALSVPSFPVYAQHSGHGASTEPNSTKLAQTGSALRDLWLGHIFWVRNVVVETMAGNTAARAVSEREVVSNARAIAATIEPYYGKAASDKLFDLLAGHYGAVKQYLDAGTDAAKQGAAVKALTDNAGAIATFLSNANPNLPYDALLGLLAAHGGHHVAQIQQLRAKQYESEAKTWDAMKVHMYAISDALVGALAKQFPAKFS